MHAGQGAETEGSEAWLTTKDGKCSVRDLTLLEIRPRPSAELTGEARTGVEFSGHQG